MTTRTFTRDELDTFGLPDDCAGPQDPDPNGLAVELHQEQVDTRRWVSVHELVFRAPDDGKTYRIHFEQGLTESQDDTDPWNDERTVTATEVVLRPVTTQQWQDVAEQPEPAAPEVGQRYTNRTLYARTVTVTRVWDTDAGTAVAFEWRHGQCRNALPLGVFLGTYEPVVAPEPTVTVTVAQLEAALRPWLELLHVDLHYSLAEPEDGSPDQYPAETALLFGRLRKAAGGAL